VVALAHANVTETEAVYPYLVYPNGSYDDVTGAAVATNSPIAVLDKLVDNQGGAGDSATSGGIGSSRKT
jgi:hypothetical protein